MLMACMDGLGHPLAPMIGACPYTHEGTGAYYFETEIGEGEVPRITWLPRTYAATLERLKTGVRVQLTLNGRPADHRFILVIDKPRVRVERAASRVFGPAGPAGRFMKRGG
jgi:hypothetical protein